MVKALSASSYSPSLFTIHYSSFIIHHFKEMTQPPTASTSAYGPGEAPRWEFYSKCIHCGLCLNSCPTYRELGVEMDSPRGRIYQMVQVSTGKAKLDDSYVEHLDLCLACRACESACPSGVP